MNGKRTFTLGKIQYQNLRADFESECSERAILPSEGMFSLNLRADFECEGKNSKQKKVKTKTIFELLEEFLEEIHEKIHEEQNSS